MRVGAGCDRCRGTGYSGRVGIFELLTIDDAVRQLIQDRATASTIQRAAVAAGMRTLHADGVAKALAGRTTIGEVERVTSRQAS